jgi:hypothetical protein
MSGKRGEADGAGPAEPVSIEVPGKGAVSALWLEPPAARGVLVLAHGAGAGMHHAFLEALAGGLAARGLATLRYQFPYMEAKKRVVDRPPVAHAAVRAAVAAARARRPDLPLFAGGKSFGGRMTSQAQAGSPLPGVRTLVFFGFPLHPPGQPNIDRAAHLDAVTVPMLFLQGTRDEFAERERLRGVVARLGARARLILFDDADHGFKPRGQPIPMAALCAAAADALGTADPGPLDGP